MRESTFSFWQDTDFNAWPDQPLEVAGNAYQGQAGEEESWFFEASSSDGTYLNVIMTVYAGQGRAYLNFSPPGQEVIAREITSSFTAASTHLDVSMAGAHIYQQDGLFYLEWQAGDTALALRFQPLLPVWQPGDGRINYGEGGNKYFIWMVPVPRAQVSGTVALAGNKITFSGNGYHDHRRCNFPLAAAVAGAYLGRYYAGDYTLLWADFWGNLLYSGQEVTAFYLARCQEPVAASGNLTVQVYDQESKDGLSYPAEISLQAGTVPPVRLIIKEPVVLATGSPAWLGARSLYCRHQGELQIAVQPELTVTGLGVSETLIINNQVDHGK